MSVVLTTATDILRLCKEVRRLPLEQAVEAYNALSRVDYSQHPPELHDAAEDAMFYCVFGVERRLPQSANPDLPPSVPGSAASTEPPAQPDSGSDA